MGWINKKINTLKNSGTVKAVSTKDYKALPNRMFQDFFNVGTLGLSDQLKSFIEDKTNSKSNSYKPGSLNKVKSNWVDYQGITDNKGRLLGPYKLGNANNWLKSQNQSIDLNRLQNIDLASKGSLTGAAQQQANLALNGGLSSGARERLAQSASRDFNLNRQGANFQGNLAQLDAQSQAFDKNQAASQFNTANAIADQQARNAANQAKYQADMQAWAAQEQARATASAGKK